jgi:dienelactone hydrolase
MRTLELILVGAVLVAGAALWRRAAGRTRRTGRTSGLRDLRLSRTGRSGPLPVLAGAAALSAAILAHLLLDGLRWQLIPAATAAIVAVLMLLLAAVGARVPLGRSLAAAVVLGGMLSGLAGWALPVTIIAAPSGPHAVGTMTLVLRDTARLEAVGDSAAAPREIVLQLWYPADPAARRDPGPLMPEAAAFTALGAASLGLPPFTLGHLAQVPGHATRDVAALDAPSPVVVLSHGWTGFRTIQADLAQDLASRGYVVAAPDHTLGALVTTFPDGRAVPFEPGLLPEPEDVPAAEYARLSRALVERYADDLALVVRALAQLPPELLAGRLDVGTLAFIGHSTGGGAAVLACSREPACRAVVGFDPWVAPVPDEVLTRGLAVPLLSLRTEDWRGRPNDAPLAILHAAQRTGGMAEAVVGIDGALHRDFTLISGLSPLGRFLGLAGDTPGAETRSLTRGWTAAFLDHHVRASGGDPLLGPPAAPTSQVTVLETLEVDMATLATMTAPSGRSR